MPRSYVEAIVVLQQQRPCRSVEGWDQGLRLYQVVVDRLVGDLIAAVGCDDVALRLVLLLLLLGGSGRRCERLGRRRRHGGEVETFGGF